MEPLKVEISIEHLKTFLRLDPEDNSEDQDLVDFLETAKEEALDFLNRDFHEYDKEGQLTKTNEAPAKVKAWIKDRVATMYDNRPAPAPDFTSIRDLRFYPFKA